MQAKTLSRILGIDMDVKTNKSSSPDIELISKLKEKINTDNPLLRLSIENYKQMCKNKMLFNMMVKVLETNEKKLTKICKNIDIVIQNINSSPESIKNKIKMQKISILDLPDNVLDNIVTIWQKKIYITRLDTATLYNYGMFVSKL